MDNPKIEIDLAEILKDIQSNQKKMLQEISDVKVGLAEVKDEIKTVDEKL